MTEDRMNIVNDYDFPIIPLSPSKDRGKNKFNKLFKYINYLWKLYLLIRRQKAQVIHFQFFRRPRVESIYFLVLKGLGYNLAYTVHDYMPLDQNKIDPLFNFLVCKAANTLFVHSDTNRETLIKHVKNIQNKIRVVPDANYADFLPAGVVEKEDLRKEFGLTRDDNIILFFGHIKEYKGLDLLLDALPIASQSVKNLVLLVAGKIETEKLGQKYKEMISKIPSSVKIIYSFDFVPMEEAYKYFISTDLVALPYKRITHSGIINLAVLFGRPAAATKVGDMEDRIIEGKSGFLSKGHNPEDFSEVLVEAFSDKQRLEEMGKFSNTLGEAKFTWDDTADLLKTFYQESSK
jgi:glycosyltransferase involved in cell wall biosynthesis